MSDQTVVVDDVQEWSRLAASLPLASLYLTSTWGEYKSRKGWRVTRLCIVGSTTGKPRGLLQLQQKRLGLFTIFNVQGGIHVFDVPENENVYEDCFNALLTHIKTVARGWMLFTSHDAHDIPLAKIAMLKAGFAPVLSSGMFTYLVACENDIGPNMLSSNWRHNLRRAQKNTALVVRWAESGPDRSAAMQRADVMYENLMKRKSFAAGLDVGRIADLVVKDPNMLIVEAVLDGEVVAVRVAHVSSSHVLDFLAVSNDAAKNCYANYLLIWEFILRTRSLGRAYFDAGGIDPYKNAGVFNFKKGLGGTLATNGPMWVSASNRLLRIAAQLMQLV